MSAVDYCTKGDVRSLAEVLQVGGANPQPVDQLTETGDTLLMLACINGREEMANALIGWGANVNHTNQIGQTPLILAAMTGLEVSCGLLVQHGADVMARDRNMGSSLHNACCKGLESTVSLLIESNAELDGLNKYGNTPLIEACSLGYSVIAAELINSGCSPNIVNKSGACALMKTIDKGHREITQLLLQTDLSWDPLIQNGCLAMLEQQLSSGDVTIEWTAQPSGRTLLHDVVKCDNSEPLSAMIQQLISGGSSVNSLTIDKRAPLHFALEAKQVANATLLIEHKAALDLQDSAGTTPLHLAAKIGDQALMHQMTRLDKSQINVADKCGRSALFFAVESTEQSVALDLIQAGCVSQDCDITDEHGRSMVHLAIMHQMTKLLPALLATANCLTQQDADGCTALHAAAASGVTGTAEAVLVRTGNSGTVEVQNNDGNTPLLVAVGASDAPMANMLIKKGALICPINAAGDTAIHLAVQQAGVDMLSLVLGWSRAQSIQVEVNAQNLLGLTAVHLACRHGNTEAVRLLLLQGADFETKDLCGNTALELAKEAGVAEVFANWVPIKLIYPCAVHRLFLPRDMDLKGFLPVVQKAVGEAARLVDTNQAALSDDSFRQQLVRPEGASFNIDPESIRCPATVAQDLIDGRYLMNSKHWHWDQQPSTELAFDVKTCKQVQLVFFNTQEQFDFQMELHTKLGGHLSLAVVDHFVDVAQSLFVIVTEWGDTTLDEYILSGPLTPLEVSMVVQSLAALLILYQEQGMVEMGLQPNRVVRVGRNWKLADTSRLIQASEWTDCPPMGSFEATPVHGKKTNAIYISPEEAAALQTKLAVADGQATVLAKPETTMFHLGLIIVELLKKEPCFTQHQAGVVFEMLSYKSLSPLWSNISGSMATVLEGLLCCEPIDRMGPADLIASLGGVVPHSSSVVPARLPNETPMGSVSPSAGGSHEQTQELRQLQKCVIDLQTQFKDSTHRHMMALNSLEEQQQKNATMQEPTTCSTACAIQ